MTIVFVLFGIISPFHLRETWEFLLHSSNYTCTSIILIIGYRSANHVDHPEAFSAFTSVPFASNSDLHNERRIDAYSMQRLHNIQLGII